MIAAMNFADIPERLRALDNMADFVREAKLPARTIDRMRAGELGSVRSCQRVVEALQRLKPKRKPKAPGG